LVESKGWFARSARTRAVESSEDNGAAMMTDTHQIPDDGPEAEAEAARRSLLETISRVLGEDPRKVAAGAGLPRPRISSPPPAGLSERLGRRKRT
jgi:hypothetical protein